MPVEGLRPDIAFAPAQELNGHLVAQKEDAERLVGMRSADIAQLQCELAAAQQQAAALSKHLSQVTHAPTPQILLASFLRPLVPSALIALNLFLSKDLGQVRQHTEASC